MIGERVTKAILVIVSPMGGVIVGKIAHLLTEMDWIGVVVGIISGILSVALAIGYALNEDIFNE